MGGMAILGLLSAGSAAVFQGALVLNGGFLGRGVKVRERSRIRLDVFVDGQPIAYRFGRRTTGKWFLLNVNFASGS